MADLTAPESSTGAPEQQKLIRQERVARVAVAAVSDTAAKKYPDGPPPPPKEGEPKDPLALFRYLDTSNNPQFSEDPKDTGHNLVVQTLKGKDAHGQAFDYVDGKARISGVDGVIQTPDGPFLVCSFATEKGPVLDSTGEPLYVPLPAGEVKTTIMVAYQGEIADALKDDGPALAAAQEHINSQPQVNKPTDSPLSDDVLAQLAERYDVKDPSVKQEAETTRERYAIDEMNVLIVKKITELEAKGTDLTPDELLQLGGLRLSMIFDGEKTAINFKADALRKAGLGDQVDKIDPGGKLADEAATELGNLLHEFKNKDDSAFTDEQMKKWQDIAAGEGGMFLLMSDPDFQNVLLNNESKVCEALLGRDLNAEQLADMLKAANLPPELLEALDGKDKMSILKIILLIAAGVFVGLPALAVAAPTAAIMVGAGAVGKGGH